MEEDRIEEEEEEYIDEEEESPEEPVEEQPLEPVTPPPPPQPPAQPQQPAGEYIPGVYQCPEGHRVPFFLARTPKSSVVFCPVTGNKIGRSKVPPQAVIHDAELTDMLKKGAPVTVLVEAAKRKGYLPSDYYFRADDESILRPRPAAPGGEKRPREGKIDLSKLFEQPKPPCVVLEEVLEEFAIKEDFVRFVIRRCERKNGLHPLELFQLLNAMRAVKNVAEATVIAEEYAEALRSEMEKARQLNQYYPVSGLSPEILDPSLLNNPLAQRIMQILPLDYYRGQPGQGAQAPQASLAPQPPRLGPPQPPARQQPWQAPQPPYQPYPTGGIDVAQLISAISQILRGRDDTKIYEMIMNQQKENQQLLINILSQQTQSLAKSLSEGLRELGESFAQAIREISSAVKQAQTPRQDPELIYKAAKAEAEKEYYQKLLEIQEKRIGSMAEYISRLEEKIERVVRETSNVPADAFKTDEARLVAQALSKIGSVAEKFVDVLDKRRPIELIIKSLPQTLKEIRAVQVGAPIPEKYRETETSEELVRELEEMGLVEEAKPEGESREGGEQ